MISGQPAKRLRSRFVAAAAIAWAGVIAGALAQTAAQPWGLPELMSALGGRSDAHARFVERKYLKILDAPLELTGRLTYAAPGKF